MRKFFTVISLLALLFFLQNIFFQNDKANAQLTSKQQVSQINTESSNNIFDGVKTFLNHTGFANANIGHFVMILLGLILIFLAIKYDYEPLILVPMGMGILIGNIPFVQNSSFQFESTSVFQYLYFGVSKGIFPPLIFLGIGAMTDFSTLISNPKLLLLGAAAQIGIFATFFGAIVLGFHSSEAGAISIIGSADGPTAIFLASKLANGVNLLADGTTVKNLICPIAIAAYTFMALVPLIQPPVIYLLTSEKERKIKMKTPRAVSKLEKTLFPIIGLLLTCFIAPAALPLLGMLFFGNLLKESGVTKRLAATARTILIDIVTILLGVSIGAAAQSNLFLTSQTFKIFCIGAVSFLIATACGILFAKFMNLFLSGDKKINPLIGAAGVSAIPDSAILAHSIGLKADPKNHLLIHAIAPNVAGVIGSALTAGVLLSYLL